MKIIDASLDDVSSMVTNLKNIETNSIYWVKIERTINEGKAEVETYPLVPFFGPDEQIVWYNLLLAESNGNIQAIRLQIITTLRILEYDYRDHKGKIFEFQSFDRVDVRPYSDRNYYELYSTDTGQFTNSLLPDKIKRRNAPKEVVFLLKDKEVFSFKGIEEPEYLLDVTKVVLHQVNLARAQNKGPKESSKGSSNKLVKCPHCGKYIPPNSNFCNSCGSRISTICSKCKNTNPADSRYCNNCGFILN
jgi:hypothetical protein